MVATPQSPRSRSGRIAVRALVIGAASALLVTVAALAWQARSLRTQPSAVPGAAGGPAGGLMDPDALRARIDWRSHLLATGQLDEVARASIERGRALFARTFLPAEGLGPYFNDRSCDNCHPGPLGRGPISRSVRLFMGPRLLDESDQTTAARRMPLETLPGYPPYAMPADFVFSGKRLPPSLRGLGWIEAIPGEQIEAQKHCDPQPGRTEICGLYPRRPHAPRGSRRFGSQFGVATIDEFVVGALQEEMGLTATVTNINNEVGRDEDPVPDPEMRNDQIVDLANFVAFSAPPGQPLPPADEPGLRRFREVGCAGCHWSSFTVEGKPAPQMYTDLLMHDLGPGRGDVRQLDIGPKEYFRTMALWGLRDVPGPYLHDGKAATLEEAILLHGGEATAVRAAYQSLPAEARTQLIGLLKDL